MRRTSVLAVAILTPTLALAGPFSGFTAVGEMGVDFSDPSGLSDITFSQQIVDTGVVGPGIECDIIPPYVSGDFSDVDQTLTVQVNTSWSVLPFNGLRFTLTGPSAPSLSGAYLISTDIPGFTPSRITATGSRVALNFQGMSSVGYVQLGFETGPIVHLSGTCPGTGTAEFSGFTPGGQIGIVSGSGPGSFTIPSGSCAGTRLNIAGPRVLATISADTSGERTLMPAFAPAVCGAPIQAVDLATCGVTPLVYVP